MFGCMVKLKQKNKNDEVGTCNSGLLKVFINIKLLINLMNLRLIYASYRRFYLYYLGCPICTKAISSFTIILPFIVLLLDKSIKCIIFIGEIK